MELPDPLEQMEARAERMEDLYYDGQWHCYNCREPIEPGHENTASADPASPPVCDECLREYYEGRNE
jgi:hypothetical protein